MNDESELTSLISEARAEVARLDLAGDAARRARLAARGPDAVRAAADRERAIVMRRVDLEASIARAEQELDATAAAAAVQPEDHADESSLTVTQRLDRIRRDVTAVHQNGDERAHRALAELCATAHERASASSSRDHRTQISACEDDADQEELWALRNTRRAAMHAKQAASAPSSDASMRRML